MAVAVLASCSSGASPVLSPAPSVAPVREGTPGGGACALSRGGQQTGESSDGLVTVDRGPRGATLVWWPGMNSRTCRALLTTLDQPAARRLARDVRAARAAPSGTYSCPADDGAAVSAYFRYAGRSDAEVVDVGLSGCAFVGAPGRQPRRQTHDLARDLRRAAPPEWLAYLGGR